MPSTTELESIATQGAPAAIGPYAQAVVGGGFCFCSGQIGLDPNSGELVPGGVEAETERVLQNLAAVLEAAGTGLDRVAKVTIYLAAMEDFGVVNEVYARHFGDSRPARATVAVKALPKGACVEMDAIAVLDPSGG